MEDNVCLVCLTSNFRYDEEHFCNICNVCNTMQEATGIGMTVYENDQNINFSRLKTIKINKKRKLTLAERKKLKIQDAIPWDLNELFKWIFDKQVESMRPYVVDWEEFLQLSKRLWEMYSNTTGKGFDILNESIDNIKMKKYPIGWGTKYDPKAGINQLAKAGKEFSKYKHDLVGSGSGDSDIDYDKIDRNAKKVKIERMVHMKKLEKEELIIIPENNNDIAKEEREIMMKATIQENFFVKDEEEDEELKNEKIELKVNEILNDNGEWSLSSDSESALSDEDDPNYVQLDYIDEKEKNKVRTLRKKKEHEVMWTGSYNAQASRLMENNVALLFLTVYFSTTKKIECCCLMDVLKLIRNKVIPYIRIRRFIPNDLFCINDQSYHSYVLRDHAPSWNFMIVAFNKLLRTLKFGFLIKFDMDILIRRMLRDLNLPLKFGPLIDLLRKDTSKIEEANIGATENTNLIRTRHRNMGKNYPYTLFPEPYCLAHIFFVLKIVFKFDCKYEVEISNLVTKLERSETIEQGKWFNWLDWWQEMYKEPSFSNCKTWEDIEKVGDSISFLEGREVEDNYSKFSELGLDWNEDLNQKGRKVRKNKGSHQDVIEAVEKPFREIFNALKDSFSREKKILKDFTDSDIRYLIDANKVKKSLFPDSDRIPFSQEGGGEGEGDPYLIMQDLSDIISQHKLSYERISYEEPDFNDNIFHKNFTSNTNEIEEDLLRILTYDTGIDSKNVLHSVFTIERNRFDNKRKKAKRKNRRSFY